MNRISMKTYFVVILLVCFYSLAEAGRPVNSGKYPGNTVANLAKALEKDVKKNIKTFIKKKYSCRKYSVLNTEHVSMDGEVYVDRKGRLLAGSITEKWVIEACGNNYEIGIILAPDGAKGSYIAIALLNEHAKSKDTDASLQGGSNPLQARLPE